LVKKKRFLKLGAEAKFYGPLFGLGEKYTPANSCKGEEPGSTPLRDASTLHKICKKKANKKARFWPELEGIRHARGSCKILEPAFAETIEDWPARIKFSAEPDH